MIEIYLAVLLFGLGTYFNSNSVKKNEGGPALSQNNQIQTQNGGNFYEHDIPSAVKELETKYENNLDDKCREIQKRDFSNLLDEKSKELYKLRKLSETNRFDKLSNKTLENSDILKYQPKKTNAVYSNLTGTELSVEKFTNSEIIGKDGSLGSDKINNTWAVPYFSSSSTQNMTNEGFQNKLDNFTGRSQFDFHKKETKTFFVPNKNVGLVNGSPVSTDILQDRYVKSNYQTNALPYEKIRVAPGLGQNYGTEGTGGKHQFEINEIARPKTIDEIRSLSKQQKTYTTPTISGKSIDKRSSIPNIAKNRTSKTFAQTEDNLLKTTGAFLKPKAEENFIIKDTNRINSKSFFGSASPVSDKKTYTSPQVKESIRNNYGSAGVRNAFVNHSWDASSEISDYGKSTIKLPPNERDVTQKRTHTSNFVTMVKSIIAPLQDKIRGTRKDFIVGNPNPEGYVGASIPSKQTVYDPNDIAKTTVKETTLEYDHEGNVSGPNKQTVHDPNDVARTTVKETTLEYDHEGNVMGPKRQTVYDPNDIARTTIKETTVHSKMQTVVSGAKKVTVYDPNDVARTTIKETTEINKQNGFLKDQIPNKPINYDIQAPKTTIKETTSDNKHVNNVSYVRGDGKGYLSNEFFAPATLKQLTSDNEYEGNVYSSLFSSGGYLSNEFYAPATIKQYTSDFEYMGSASSNNKASTSYASAYNAITNSLREKTLKGRAPTQNGAKVFNGGGNAINVAYKKQGTNVSTDKTLRISRVAQQNRDAKSENITAYRTPLSNKSQKERYNPAQLNMLRKNPYAISLNRNFGASRGAGTGEFSDSGSGSGSDSD